ncbi:hypothetical protein [Paenibacillus naphthalenovorans]|uniref:hypothetical protein n=1 Tax=Paenibacillus naphthalenovorans TaxID=162209 RepID=UPI003D2B5541
MILVLHDGTKILNIFDRVKTIDGNTIHLEDGELRGISAQTIVIDGYTYGEDVTPAVYEDDVQIYPEVRVPYFQKGTSKKRVGDPITVTSYTDMKASLGMTVEQFNKQRLDDLEMIIADAIARGVL